MIHTDLSTEISVWLLLYRIELNRAAGCLTLCRTLSVCHLLIKFPTKLMRFHCHQMKDILWFLRILWDSSLYMCFLPPFTSMQIVIVPSPFSLIFSFYSFSPPIVIPHSSSLCCCSRSHSAFSPVMHLTQRSFVFRNQQSNLHDIDDVVLLSWTAPVNTLHIRSATTIWAYTKSQYSSEEWKKNEFSCTIQMLILAS